MIYSVKTDIKLYFIILCLSTTISCDSSDAVQVWHKGNLHTHSLWSDGDDFPEMIIDWYKKNDYKFIALSDHNTIADGVYWYKIKQSDIENKTLKKYQERFNDWVESKTDLLGALAGLGRC